MRFLRACVRAFLTQSSSDLRDGNRSDEREGEESALRDKERELQQRRRSRQEPEAKKARRPMRAQMSSSITTGPRFSHIWLEVRQ